MTRKSGDLPFPVTSRYARGVRARISVTVTLEKCCRMRITVFFKKSVSAAVCIMKLRQAVSQGRLVFVAGQYDTQFIKP